LSTFKDVADEVAGKLASGVLGEQGEVGPFGVESGGRRPVSFPVESVAGGAVAAEDGGAIYTSDGGYFISCAGQRGARKEIVTNRVATRKVRCELDRLEVRPVLRRHKLHISPPIRGRIRIICGLSHFTVLQCCTTLHIVTSLLHRRNRTCEQLSVENDAEKETVDFYSTVVVNEASRDGAVS
jgi:hypothetical protein